MVQRVYRQFKSLLPKQNAKDDYPYTLEKGTLEDSSVLTHGLNDIGEYKGKTIEKRPK